MSSRVSRLLQVALGSLIIPFVVGTSLHAQRAGSGGHVGGTSHPSPSFSSAPRTGFRSAMQPTRAPSAQNHHQNQHRNQYRSPVGEHRGGVGYRNRDPYFYAGYPEVLPFGYGFPFGYGNSLEESAPQVAADDSSQPPLENPPEVAESDSPMFRPAYQPQWAPAPAQPATTLVFRDGRPAMEVHNYALTGSTLYALDGEKRLEIPLSQLDLPATTEANRKTGVDFALPTSH